MNQRELYEAERLTEEWKKQYVDDDRGMKALEVVDMMRRGRSEPLPVDHVTLHIGVDHAVVSESSTATIAVPRKGNDASES
jgi:hypothetical protein